MGLPAQILILILCIRNTWEGLFFPNKHLCPTSDKIAIGSLGGQSACNARDTGLIPGLGRSPGEGIGYPFQYSWVSLVTQMVKNPPAMQEIWVQSLDWEDPLDEGMATHSSILAWSVPMDRGAWQATIHGVKKSPDFLT